MYRRTPLLRKSGGIWSIQPGVAVNMDVWMLGIGLGLLTDNSRSMAGTDGRRAGWWRSPL